MATYDPNATYEITETTTTYREDADGAWGMRVTAPVGAGPFPAILSVHGGGWNGDNWRNYLKTETFLARSGVVVASIQLRRAPMFPYPASVQDVNFGTRWLKVHAKDYNGDGSKVGLIGFSSGGHLIPLSAIRPFDPRYAALPLPEAPNVDAVPGYVIPCWGVINPWLRFDRARQKGKNSTVESHYAFFVTDEAMKDATPQYVLESGERPAVLPPTLMIHGDADDNVLPADVDAFADAYRAAGGEIEVEYFHGMKHTFINATPGPEADRAHEVIKAYIARQMAATPAVAGRA